MLNFKKNILQSNSFISLFLITGVIGFILGIIKADFQVSLEAAQVLLGLVQYEPSSLIYGYYSNNYSLINYLSALFLYLSNSEILSSILISGIVGCIGMQTLGMLLFLITGDLWASVALSLILALKNIFLPGISYSINFLGTPHTYGRLGLFFSLYPILIASLLSQKIGALLSSISLIIHPVYGALLNVSLLVANFRKKNWVNPTNIKYYLYGVLFVLVIFLYQKIAFFPANEVSDIARLDALKDAESIFKNYLLDWDKHRQKFNGIETLNLSFLCSIGTFILALVNIHIIHKKKTGINKEIFWFYVLIFTFISWIFFYIPSWLNISYKNRFLISSMPSRFINLSIFIFTPILFGTLYIFTKKYLIYLVEFKNKFLLLMAIFFLILISFSSEKLLEISRLKFEVERLVEYDHKKYILTTVENNLLQIKARVKIISPQIDGYIYNPSIRNLIQLNQFTEELFGVSLKKQSDASKNLLHQGEIPSDIFKDLWEDRSCRDWEYLAKKYKIGLIVTPINFKLNLKNHSIDNKNNQYLPECYSND